MVFAVCDPSKRNCLEQHVADPKNERWRCRHVYGPRPKKAKKPAPASTPRQQPQPTPQPAATGGHPNVGPRQKSQAAAFDSFGKRTRCRANGSEKGSSAGDDDSGDD
tara:strand:+ start:46 stop:366 length:321 start_codon:yes stop_codon:yes gene_type:complete